jgi:AmmeMemoRadiSam system protein B
MFYPADREELAAFVEKAMAGTETTTATKAKGLKARSVKALIVPHAGYVYSGSVAGAGFGLLKGALIKRVILVGPSHQYPVRSATSGQDWHTPLGTQKIKAFEGLPIMEEALGQEHSLEVQLPFIQTALPKALIMPIIYGDENPRELASIIMAELREDDLIVVSSDLSHYLPYNEAVVVDKKSIKTMLDLDEEGFLDACGEVGIRMLLHIARQEKWKPRLVLYRNSGDTAGDKRRVVGYASVEFS